MPLLRQLQRVVNEDDLYAAYCWYEEKSAGLGEEFLRIFYSSISSVKGHPFAWQVAHRDFRRYLLNRFPYSLYYLIDNNQIIVFGVLHGARDKKLIEEALDSRYE